MKLCDYSGPGITISEKFHIGDYMFLDRENLPLFLLNAKPLYSFDSMPACISWTHTLQYGTRYYRYKYTAPRLKNLFLKGFDRYYSRNFLIFSHTDFLLKVGPGLIWDDIHNIPLVVCTMNKGNTAQELWVDSAALSDPQFKKLKKAVTDLYAEAVTNKVPVHIVSGLKSYFTDLIEMPSFDDFEEEVDYYDNLLLLLKEEIVLDHGR